MVKIIFESGNGIGQVFEVGTLTFPSLRFILYESWTWKVHVPVVKI